MLSAATTGVVANYRRGPPENGSVIFDATARTIRVAVGWGCLSADAATAQGPLRQSP